MRIFQVLFILGIIAFIGGLIGLIVTISKKKPKKVPIIVMVISALMILGGGAVSAFNFLALEATGGNLGVDEIKYVKAVEDSFSKLIDESNVYGGLVESYQAADGNYDEQWASDFQESCDRLVEYSDDIKKVEGNTDSQLYKEINIVADSYNQIGKESPEAYFTNDEEKQMDLLLKAADAFDATMNIQEILDF